MINENYIDKLTKAELLALEHYRDVKIKAATLLSFLYDIEGVVKSEHKEMIDNKKAELVSIINNVADNITKLKNGEAIT